MKYIVALQNKMDLLQAQAVNCLKKKEGQNTVEYLLMLGVVVGVALAAGFALKKMMPDLFDSMKGKILGGIGQTGGGDY